MSLHKNFMQVCRYVHYLPLLILVLAVERSWINFIEVLLTMLESLFCVRLQRPVLSAEYSSRSFSAIVMTTTEILRWTKNTHVTLRITMRPAPSALLLESRLVALNCLIHYTEKYLLHILVTENLSGFYHIYLMPTSSKMVEY